MNYRPWHRRLLINPIEFLWSAFRYLSMQRGEYNPTRHFGIRQNDFPLQFNLENGKLNGIALGCNLDELRPFGKADLGVGDANSFSLDYASMGLAACFSQERLVSFEIDFDSMFLEHPTKFSPCSSLTISTMNGVFDLNNSSSTDALFKIFGEPYGGDSADYKYGIEHCHYFRTETCRVLASLDSRNNNLIHIEFATENVA